MNIFITDSNGFSADVDDLPVTMQKAANVYRVIILGGSTVFGQGDPRPSKNTVAILDELLSCGFLEKDNQYELRIFCGGRTSLHHRPLAVDDGACIH